MAPPAIFQKYANKVVNGTYKNTDMLWERTLASSDRTLANDIRSAASKTMLDTKLVQRLTIVHQDKSGPKR